MKLSKLHRSRKIKVVEESTENYGNVDKHINKWHEVLDDREKDLLDDLLNAQPPYPTTRYEIMASGARQFVDLLTTLDEVLPFDGADKYNLTSWFDDARNKGLLTPQEVNALRNFCINTLYF